MLLENEKKKKDYPTLMYKMRNENKIDFWNDSF